MQYKDGKNYTEFIREIVSDSGKLVSDIDIECKNTKRVLKKILRMNWQYCHRMKRIMSL